MKQKMVVTNLRIPEEDYLQVKAVAAESGLSVNEYIKKMISHYSKQIMLNYSPMEKKPSIWDLPEIAKKIKNKPMGWSKEDEIIYGF